MGVALAFIAYLDRASISQAAPFIMRELQLSKIQMGYVFSAFGLTYALCELPSGWLSDRVGPRKVLTRVVLCWSFFTAATGWAWNFASLLTVQLLFGAGEAGCFPGLAKVFSSWLPREERPFAEGLKAAMARFGAAVAPSFLVLLYVWIGWRQSFAVFGAVGLIWAYTFFRRFRDRPEQHPEVSESELALILKNRARLSGGEDKMGHGAVLRHRSAWALCIQWFCHFYGFYFYVTWLPTYLEQARGLNLRNTSLLAGLPLLLAGSGCLVSGWILPHLSRRWSIGVARRSLAYISYGGAAALVLVFTFVQDSVLAMLVLGLSSFTVELSTPVTWTTAMDLGGRSVGTLTGVMNTLGQFGGSIAPTLIGYVLAATHNDWTITFYISACVYLAGALCWSVLDPVTPLDTPPQSDKTSTTRRLTEHHEVL
jgi:MFS family permease